MIEEIRQFQTGDFYTALQNLFKTLKVPVNYITEEPATPRDILGELYKPDHSTCKLMDDVYFLGMIDDAAFEGAKSLDPAKIESDYDGILIFGVTLHTRENGLLPTRGQLAEITRSFNRKFHYTPVVVVFKYENHIAFANAERLKYKQEWREGEKAGKVSLLRNIDIKTPHSGHMRILLGLVIKTTGPKAIKTFAGLYSYWQEVFNVSLLNKKFYEELSNWYFWAVKEVKFPSEPTIHSLFEETGSSDDKKLHELIQEHKSKNVIRLLTRFLFVWFIKEKKLIPGELFDSEYLKRELLNDLSPYNEGELFKSINIKSHYYKAVLQNLFFATLNQEMGKRGFRRDGQNMNVTNLLRYESCFKDTQKFVDLVESIVPFMNGGLFECLDKPHSTKKGPKGGDVIVYKDGFSDRKDNDLKVPDYLFFGHPEDIDLSSEYGSKARKYKQAAVKGLINIFNSYKFTIAENTPIEEDVALDPELLGRVFENLLASYNPETKTTARKQTGSFYTPREIVNYMVDESLVDYLRNTVTGWDMAEEELDAKLHELFSFDPVNPFTDSKLQKEIIKALDRCTILDPACGSGAFPMGVLQKIVHILHKIDPQNIEWKQRQISRVDKAIDSLEEIDDSHFRKQSIRELEAQKSDIEYAFANNELDYGRKLFLIENCIYGVDIQPIAVQISKLRFFISLVVDQKVNKDKDNFGILPLPNLETKFVAANTLVGIEKQGDLGSPEIKRMENELKDVRHRIFSAKTPRTKRKLRDKDQTLRKQMGEQLIKEGWPNKTAQQLAGWNPYDQNASSDFFDPEWMFGVQEGFDVVIGNPPYMRIQGIRQNNPRLADLYKNLFTSATGSFDLYVIFMEKGMKFLKEQGLLNFINPDKWVNASFGKGIRSYAVKNRNVHRLISFGDHQVFSASTYSSLVWMGNESKNSIFYDKIAPAENTVVSLSNELANIQFSKIPYKQLSSEPWILTSGSNTAVMNRLLGFDRILNSCLKIFVGLQTSKDTVYFLKEAKELNDHYTAYSPELDEEITIEKGLVKPLLLGDQVHRYERLSTNNLVVFPYLLPDVSEGKAILLTAEQITTQFPKGWDYLKRCETVLRQREGGRFDNSEWYQFGRKQGIDNGGIRKLIAPDISLGGNFSIDLNGQFYTTTTLYGYIKKDNTWESYAYWLALLNSKVLWFYLKNSGSVLANGYFRYKPAYLSNFPVPISTTAQEQIISTLSEMVLFSKSNSENSVLNISKNAIITSVEETVDACVFDLYFLDHMKEKQIDILQFVKKDLEEVMQNEDFDKLPDNEKEEIIEELHARWTNPDSEVRNRIKLFAVRSPDILKPILESR